MVSSLYVFRPECYMHFSSPSCVVHRIVFMTKLRAVKNQGTVAAIQVRAFYLLAPVLKLNIKLHTCCWHGHEQYKSRVYFGYLMH
jgi:hypothetical protein